VNHEEAATLLAAYALDALPDDEVAALEEHLARCPSCRSEVDGHRRTAALLGDVGAPAPEGLWDRIAADIAGGARPVSAPDLPPVATRRLVAVPALDEVPQAAPARPARWPLTGALAAAAAAVVLAAVLLTQVLNVDSQVQHLRSALRSTGLATAIVAADNGPHRTIELTSATTSGRHTVVRVLESSDGTAYWVWSSMAKLPVGRTYQIWGLSHGKIVSLGLAGNDPHAYSVFRVEPGITELMVTAEPAGGTPVPTGPVLAAGTL